MKFGTYVILILNSVFLSEAKFTENEKKEIKDAIYWKPKINFQSGKRPCPFTEAPRNFVEDKWKKYIVNHPVILFPNCSITILHTLGNYIGNYFNSLSCAQISHAHFLATDNVQGTHPKEENDHKSHKKRPHFPFLNSFPSYVPPNKYVSVIESKALANSSCLSICEYFCWTYQNAPWLQMIPRIIQIMRKGFQAHLDANQGFPKGTTIQNITDKSTLPLGTHLPLIPDVVIHYRCGDNIEVPEEYSLLPFRTYLPLIPSHSRHIFILSDPPDRSSLHENYAADTSTKKGRSGIHEFSFKCVRILHSLYAFLSTHYSNSHILLKRGGDPFLDFIRIAYANTTICSASTFCLWPGIATNGTTYFPVTGLVARGTAPYLGQSFKWIRTENKFMNITKKTPLPVVLSLLNG